MKDLVKVRYPNGFEHVMNSEIATVLKKRGQLVIVKDKKADEPDPIFEQPSTEKRPSGRPRKETAE